VLVIEFLEGCLDIRMHPLHEDAAEITRIHHEMGKSAGCILQDEAVLSDRKADNVARGVGISLGDTLNSSIWLVGIAWTLMNEDVFLNGRDGHYDRVLVQYIPTVFKIGQFQSEYSPGIITSEYSQKLSLSSEYSRNTVALVSVYRPWT
jgi:hypothetical protein